MPAQFADAPAFRAGYDELAAFKAGQDVRRSTLPASPNDYKTEFPADFKVPDGVTYEFKADDPLLAQARTVMHDIDQGKVSGQEAFSKLLALYAGGQVATQQQIQTARNAEIQKLGAAGPARIDALTTFFRAYLGQADGDAVMARAFTAADVQRLEKMVSKITGQGGASFRGNGREPPQPQGRLTSEQRAALTPAQKLDYARTFDQRTMPDWRDPRQ